MSDDIELNFIPAGNMFTKIPALPSDATVTMAYVPFQTDFSVYEDEKALCNGTLFKCLNKPFLRGAIK